MKTNNLLIIFIKNAQLGKVKTRLAKELGAERTLDFYRAMVCDVLERINDLRNYDLQIHFDPPDAGQEIQKWLGDTYQFRAQINGDLGARMQQAFAQGFAEGYQKITLIGCDIPEISAGIINNAFAILEKHDLVLGPSEDGGYYLVGLKNMAQAIFENIPWSTEFVLDETLKIARAFALSYKLIEPLPDIDNVQDLQEFVARLMELPLNHFPGISDFLQKEATLQAFMQNLEAGSDQ